MQVFLRTATTLTLEKPRLSLSAFVLCPCCVEAEVLKMLGVGPSGRKEGRNMLGLFCRLHLRMATRPQSGSAGFPSPSALGVAP